MLIQQETKEWVLILKVIVVILFLLVVCKVLKNVFDYLGSFIISKPTNMVSYSNNPFRISLFHILSVYKQSRTSASSIQSLIVEYVRGICCEMYSKERIFWTYLFQKPAIVFYKPETVQALLSSPAMVEKSIHYKFVHDWLGTGLFTSPSEKWRKRRKILTPTFHFSILEDFIPVFQEHSSVLVSKLRALTSEPWVDIVPLAGLCTLDIICQSAMGVRVEAQADKNDEYVRAAHKLAGAAFYRGLRPWLYPDTIYYMSTEGKKNKANLQCVHGFTRKVIKEKKAEMIERNSSEQEIEQFSARKRKAFLEFLLEYHFKDPSLTEEDIREEVDTFMFAGHDTTGMGLSWTLYCVGLYPEVQKKIFEELDDIFQNDSEREVTRQDLAKMKYLECAIKETLRLYPPAPFLMRECNETFKFLDYTIFPGSFCVVFIYGLHRDRESFPDPEKFIPERFLPENSRGRHPYAYVPFSAGPRNCIGQKFGMMEMKTLAANIFRTLRVTSLDPRDKVLVAPNITLQNAKPLRLRFEIRQK